MPKDKLQIALKVFGNEYVEAMASILSKADKIASGDLIKSLKTRVFKTGFGTSYTLKVIAATYLKYVESGRRPNSTPPPVVDKNGNGILKWTRQKGIPEGAAFPIAKSIGEKGIKPLDVIDKAFSDVQKSIEYRRLEDGVSDWVDDLITDKLKGMSKNRNITFK
tara:strand:+ start:374 stop:865 length:492 start_codon:yes stop_codon:yes gene_type:complete